MIGTRHEFGRLYQLTVAYVSFASIAPGHQRLGHPSVEKLMC